MGIWLRWVDKTQFRFLVTSGCLNSREVWWGLWIGSFGQKLRYFTDQNGPKGGLHENEFWVFSNSEMNITNSHIGKSRWKYGEICLVSPCSLPKFPSHVPTWKVLLHTFRKWYCLLCYGLLFWRYLLKSKNFVQFLLSQHLF